MRPEEKVAARIKQALLNDKEAKAPAFLGNHAGTVQADNSGMVYVTLLNGEVLTVYNGRVPNVPRLFVSIGYGGSKRLQVLEQRDVFQGQKYPDVPNHASLHTFPGADTVPIRGEQFLPGLVTPKTGVTVRIYGMPYELADGWHVLTTQDLDLTSSIPSSGALYARLEADDTGAVTISLGSAVGARGELEFSDIPAADPDKFSLAAVKLYAGQTSLIFLPTDTDIIDLRFGRMSGGTFDLAAEIHAATSDSSFHDDDEFSKSDSQDSWGLKKFTWANVKTALNSIYQAILTAATLGDFIVALSSKITPSDADELVFSDSLAGGDAKRISWASVKSELTSLYAALSHTHPASSITAGTMATDRLGGGTADGTTFLSGDQTYKKVLTPHTDANDIFRCDSPGGVSAFAGTIATLPGGATLTYNVSSGQEGAMVPVSTSHLAKLRLYNTTRGTYALISNCVTGTNTITLTANVPAGWQVGDTITIASQTVSGGGLSWTDFEITDATLLGKSGISLMFGMRTASAAGDGGVLHPTETYGNGKNVANNTNALNITNWVGIPLLKLNSNLFSLTWTGSPSIVFGRISGYLQ